MELTYTSQARNTSKSLAIPNVFVVDSDASMRESLEVLIESAGWRPRVSASAEEFLAGPRDASPGCLLMELHLPGLGGLDLQRLVSDQTALPVIFMSKYVDVQATVKAMKAGAFEFLSKPCTSEDLLNVIGCAIARSHAALRQLAQSQALQGRYELLSRREREVMSLVTSGRLNKQVGGELGISEITVKAHRGKMMRKMQAASFAHLVNMVASLGGDSALRASQG